LIQAGLSDKQAHSGYLILTVVNFLTTIGAVVLVDRKGRKFLLSLGSAGVIVSLACAGMIFHQTEKQRVDCRDAMQMLVTTNQRSRSLSMRQQRPSARRINSGGQPATLIVIYSYGDFRAATTVARSDDLAAKPIEISRDGCLPVNKVVAFFSNPFADLDAARRHRHRCK